MYKLKWLITGTGRCGSVYGARLLSSLGVPCGHEAVFTPDGSLEAIRRLSDPSIMQTSVRSIHASGKEWLSPEDIIVADSSYMAAPYLTSDIFFKDVGIIHMVRNPIKVISSFINALGYFVKNRMEAHSAIVFDPAMKYQRFIYSHVPDLCQDLDQVSRACLYYILWNEKIEFLSKGRKYLFHNVESDPKPIMDFLGVDGKPFTQKNMNTIPADKVTTFADIPDGDVKDRLVEIMKRYGYT